MADPDREVPALFGEIDEPAVQSEFDIDAGMISRDASFGNAQLSEAPSRQTNSRGSDAAAIPRLSAKTR